MILPITKSNFIEKLYTIREDVNNTKALSLSELVETRLNKSLQTYTNEIENAYNNLVRRDALRIARKINRRERKDE